MFKIFIYLIFFVLFMTLFFLSSALLLKSFLFLAKQIKLFGSGTAQQIQYKKTAAESEDVPELLELDEVKS